MSKWTRQKGPWFETQIQKYLASRWDDRIVRIRAAGANDPGDIANLRVRDQKVAVECKNVVKLSLGPWVGEAQKERDNIGAIAGIVIHKRAGKGQPEDQYVTTTLGEFMRILDLSVGKGSVPL